jgi:iron(III) transport system substrate-binding protein
MRTARGVGWAGWPVGTLVLVALLLVACAPGGTSAPAGGTAGSAPGASAGGASTAAPGWQAEWDRLVAAARQEGSVTVVIQTGDLYRNWALEFEKAFPGIRVDVTGLPGRDVIPRVLGEQRGGQYLWDVYVGGNQSGLSLRDGGALDPMRPILFHPEVVDDSAWFGGFAWGFADLEGQYLFTHRVEVAPTVRVNRDTVPESELNRVEQLVDPKWKGRISWQDPTVPGAGSADAGHLLLAAGEPWYRQLFAQEIVATRDQRQQVDWLVRSRYPIGISPSFEALQAYQQEGVGLNVRSLAFDSDLGRRLSMSLGTGLFTQAPHPNAAKLYLNWALTKEAQTLWVRHLGNQVSRRLDVLGPPELAPDPKVQYRESVNLEKNAHFIDQAQDIAREWIK